ncbi:hypothetical protein OG373_06090 [Streptomyces avidinii]|uniref:hypothetical protein n=1 Tax=Streptomyces avidinii TaxID=1895 RepID=UPI0038682BF1|nr:hypothetical protein OG373_06090 [Streptomyces avidinii]
MSKLVFWVLDVGQGSGNFVQLFDDSDKLIGSLLFDLGSEGKKSEAGFPSAQTVAALLGNPGTLDLVALSHSDSDHINLIPELLSYFTTSELAINTVRYGGDYARYQKRTGTNILAELGTYMPGTSSPQHLPPGFSAFRGDPAPAPDYTLGDLKLWILMANAAAPGAKKAKIALQARTGTKHKAADGSNANTNSLVLLVGFRGLQFIVTGDATGTTLYQINLVVNTSIKKDYLDAVVMLTLPHHGSATTTFDVGGGIDGEDNLKNFVTNTTPYSLTGSADKRRSYKHPSAKVMEYFWAGLARGEPYWKDPTLGDRHFYTAYFTPGDAYDYKDGKGALYTWPPSAWWYSVQTASDIYTNMYVYTDMMGGQQEIVLPPNSSALEVPDNPVPPRALGVAWKYTVTDTVTLEMQVNRPDYERMIAARGFVPAGWPDPAALGEAQWISLPSADAAVVDDSRPAAAAPPEPAPTRRTAPTSQRPLPRLRELP